MLCTCNTSLLCGSAAQGWKSALCRVPVQCHLIISFLLMSSERIYLGCAALLKAKPPPSVNDSLIFNKKNSCCEQMKKKKEKKERDTDRDNREMNLFLLAQQQETANQPPNAALCSLCSHTEKSRRNLQARPTDNSGCFACFSNAKQL